MDEQRLQAYVTLIEQLLGCPQGQEAELLQANAELLDADLLAVMEQFAAYLESQGDGNAGWLRGFAAQLAQAMGLETAVPAEMEDTAAAAQSWGKTLQLIYENKGNPQQIYPVWAQQQARFNEQLLAVLPTVAERLLDGDIEQRRAIASLLFVFGNLINQFPLGTRWLNLELGIAAYQQSLQVMTREAMPVDWAWMSVSMTTTTTHKYIELDAENVPFITGTTMKVIELVAGQIANG